MAGATALAPMPSKYRPRRPREGGPLSKIQQRRAKSVVLACLRQGLPVRTACKQAGVSKSAFYEWYASDPVWAAECSNGNLITLGEGAGESIDFLRGVVKDRDTRKDLRVEAAGKVLHAWTKMSLRDKTVMIQGGISVDVVRRVELALRHHSAQVRELSDPARISAYLDSLPASPSAGPAAPSFKEPAAATGPAASASSSTPTPPPAGAALPPPPAPPPACLPAPAPTAEDAQRMQTHGRPPQRGGRGGTDAPREKDHIPLSLNDMSPPGVSVGAGTPDLPGNLSPSGYSGMGPGAVEAEEPLDLEDEAEEGRQEREGADGGSEHSVDW